MRLQCLVRASATASLLAAALGFPAAAAPPRALGPDLPQLLAFNVARIDVPVAAGAALQLTVPLAGKPFVLDLARHSIRAPDFRLLVDHGDGVLVPVAPDPPRTWRGSVQALPGSSVAASIINGRLWASILTGDGESWSVEPLGELVAGADPGDHVVYRDQDVVPPGRTCGTPDGRGAEAAGAAPDDGGIAGTGLKIAVISADADVEYWQKNGSDVQATMADIENVIAAASNIYESEIHVTYEVGTIVVRTGDASADPYSSAVCATILGQFQARWAAPPESEIKRDLAQLFTGRNLADCLGIAFLGGTCDVVGGLGYSVVESRSEGLPFSQRTGLTAHETGHNFNAPHCCAGCAGCLNPPCNIMCPCIGGCTGNVTSFGPLSAPTINNYVNAITCLHPLPDPLIVPILETFPVQSLNPSIWIYNDGASISTLASAEPSPPYSMRLETFGDGSLYQDHEVRSNFINLAAYAGAGAVVRFWVEHIGSEAGETLSVQYWAGSALDQWAPLATFTSDGVDQVQFVPVLLPLDGLVPSPFHNEFRLKFFTDVDTSGGDLTNDNWFIDDLFIGVPSPPLNDLCAFPLAVGEGPHPFTTAGAHTDGNPDACGGGSPAFVNDVWFLYTPACDGDATFSLCNAAGFDSKLAVYPGGPCVPATALACSDNAPGCGQTSQVVLPVSSAAQYLVRVGATAGAGDGTLTISCASPCPSDLDGDGSTGTTDFLALLGAWGTNPGHPADLDGDGVVGVNDFLALLAAWGPC